MSAQVQRKLEFPVRKSTRTQNQKATPTKVTSSNQKTKSSSRSSRRSTRNRLTENEENIIKDVSENLLSPRKSAKRLSDDEGIDDASLQSTPSPSKKQKENYHVHYRRDETPVRGNLAVILAAARIYDVETPEQGDKENIPPGRCPLSPIKLAGNGTPRTVLSPSKLNMLQRPAPVKSPSKLNIQQGTASSSPMKSPAKLNIQQRMASPIKLSLHDRTALSSPMKSPAKLNIPQRMASPIKLSLRDRATLSSPMKSPAKLDIQQRMASPIKLSLRDRATLSSPMKSPAKLDIQQRMASPIKLSLRDRATLSSPVKSPRKLNVSSPVKSRNMKVGKPDCAAYHQAKQMFHTAKPERLVGRDKEITEVRTFLKSHMTKKTAGSLYISGAPGTGKTAVLTSIIDELKTVHSCKTVYLNCMTLDNSATVYGKLYSDITGKNAPTAKERLRAVERVLNTEGPPIIMVLDEIDQLDSKNQEILYTIFEWPSLQRSRLILVGIANALDLTDRVLPRLQARANCKPKLLNFAPYTKDQISAILKDRIKDLENDGIMVMDSMAIQFCARKISAIAGDMRKALDVCRRAVELVETDVKTQRVLKHTQSSFSPVKKSSNVPKKIGVLHINNVLSDVYGSGAAAQQQETIPLQQKLVLCSLLLMLKQGRMKEVTAGKLHEIYSKVCRSRQMSAVDQSEFQGIIMLLESRGMMSIKKAKETRLNKVTLKLNEKELEHTMQDKTLVSTILKEGLPK